MLRGALIGVGLLALVACGGRARGSSIKIEASLPPLRTVPVRTLEPPPTATPTPPPTAPLTPGPTPTPIPPPAGATITSHAGTQAGAVNSFCWSDQEGGPSQCYAHDQPSQSSWLPVHQHEHVTLRIDARIPPDEESVRPFQGTRSGFSARNIPPALETDLTVDLPPGQWSMDLCATWHNRGQPICWLFALAVSAP